MSHVLNSLILLCVIVTIRPISSYLSSSQSQGLPGNTGPKGQRGERVSLVTDKHLICCIVFFYLNCIYFSCRVNRVMLWEVWRFFQDVKENLDPL